MIRFKDIAIILLATVVAALFLKAFVLDAVVIPSASMEETLLPGDFVLINKMKYQIDKHRSAPLLGTIFPFLPGLANRTVQRGDVVVFRFPSTSKKSVLNHDDFLVKRCVAKSGDVVRVKHGRVMVNNHLIADDIFEHSEWREGNPDDFFPPKSNFSFDHYGPIRVPAKGDIIELTKESFPEWEDLIRGEGHRVGWSQQEGCVIDGRPQSIYIVTGNYFFMMGDNFYHSYDSRFWGFVPEDHVIGTASIVYWSLEKGKNGKGLSKLFNSIRWDRVGRFVR